MSYIINDNLDVASAPIEEVYRSNSVHVLLKAIVERQDFDLVRMWDVIYTEDTRTDWLVYAITKCFMAASPSYGLDPEIHAEVIAFEAACSPNELANFKRMLELLLKDQEQLNKLATVLGDD